MGMSPLSPQRLCPHLQINEIRSSVKYQLKKVLCLGVAVGNVAMADKELYVNIQVRCMQEVQREGGAVQRAVHAAGLGRQAAQWGGSSSMCGSIRAWHAWHA